jgi:hypothetical protein
MNPFLIDQKQAFHRLARRSGRHSRLLPALLLCELLHASRLELLQPLLLQAHQQLAALLQLALMMQPTLDGIMIYSRLLLLLLKMRLLLQLGFKLLLVIGLLLQLALLLQPTLDCIMVHCGLLLLLLLLLLRIKLLVLLLLLLLRIKLLVLLLLRCRSWCTLILLLLMMNMMSIHLCSTLLQLLWPCCQLLLLL